MNLQLFLMIQIRKKRESLRDQIRKQQIQNLKSKKRNQFVESIASQNLKIQINDQVQKMINQRDINSLYYFLCSPQKKSDEAITHIFESTAILLYRFLKADVGEIKNRTILDKIIAFHYTTVFLNTDLLAQNNTFLQSLFQNLNKIISDAENIQPNHIQINSYLSCFKSFIMNKDQTSQIGFTFESIARDNYLKKYILPWLNYFYNNITFLIFFALLCEDASLLKKLQNAKYLFESKQLFLKFIFQANPSNVKNKVLSLPSLLIVNLLLENMAIIPIDFIQSIFVDYLLLVKTIYSWTKPHKKYYKFVSFYDSLKILNFMVDYLTKSEHNSLKLCQSIVSANYWNFMILLIRHQGTIKTIIFSIIQKLIKNMIQKADQKIENILQLDMITTIASGIQEQNSDIVVICLRIIHTLCNYAAGTSLSYEHPFLKQLNNCQILVSLQQLQYHKNQQIRELAQILLPKESKYQSTIGSDGKIEQQND